MKSWMWVLVAGVLVIGIAGVFIMKPSSVVAPATSPNETIPADQGDQLVQFEPDALVSLTPSPVASPSGDSKKAAMTISITEAGFSPAAITVEAGDTVVFVNNGQAQHWPASDPHPTHTIYPEFDAKKGLETGETFNFMFTKVGSWGFHDHLNPSARGTVTVK